MKPTPRLNNNTLSYRLLKSSFQSSEVGSQSSLSRKCLVRSRPTSLRQTNRNPPAQSTREAIKIPRHFYRQYGLWVQREQDH